MKRPPRGRIVGTPYYLSPEQARGDPDDQRELSEVMRVIHFVTALATVGVFASHIAVDHID